MSRVASPWIADFPIQKPPAPQKEFILNETKYFAEQRAILPLFSICFKQLIQYQFYYIQSD